MVFDDLGASRGITTARDYDVRWSSYDNDHGRLTALPNANGTKVPSVGSGTDYMAATIGCGKAAEGACPGPVTVYLRRAGTAFEVVGVDR